MQSIFQKAIGILLVASSTMPPVFAKSLSDIETTASAMLTDLNQTAIALEVISTRDAQSNKQLRTLLGVASMPLDTTGIATALYYKGQCTLVVNTKTLNNDLSPNIQALISKDDLVFFITSHEVAHCISQHRQAQELRQLAEGHRLSNTFLPSKVLEHGEAGTLTPKSFQEIMKSIETLTREEEFADVLASLYTRLKNENAPSILKAIRQTRISAANNGDTLHDTAEKLSVAFSYAETFNLTSAIEVGHHLRN